MDKLEKAKNEYWRLQKMITYTTLPMYVVAGYVVIFSLLPQAMLQGDLLSHFYSTFSVIAAALLVIVLSIFITIVTIFYIPRKFNCANCRHELGAHELSSKIKFDNCKGKKGLKYKNCECIEFRLKERAITNV